MNRRSFVAGTLGAGAAVAGTRANGPLKSVMWSMLPGHLSTRERFDLARRIGFAGVEVGPVGTEQEASALRSAADAAGVRIHSVIFGGWDNPLSSPDPAVASRGLAEASAALRSAKWLGADDILLVPALVTADVRYGDAYRNSQRNVRKLIPLAEKLGILILIEEVWNKFLLSPLEYVRYIDEFRHPLVQSYFDVGNVLIWGFPQDWIRTIGSRIRRVHIKDFKVGSREWVNLRDGDVNWPEVMKALHEVGFSSYMNTELPGGDEAYLADVSARFDRILAGE